MTISRRRFLQLPAVAAPLPLVAGCAGDKVVPDIDTSLPVGPYGADATAEQVTAELDLTGKTALVTGCNSGLGFETMRVLALRGAHVIGTGRTLEKAQIACDSVDGNTTPLALELSDFQSVIDAAAAVRAMDTGLDILVCNAGINTFGELELVGGVEKIFVVNFLGHFLLVNQLLPVFLEQGKSVVLAPEGTRTVSPKLASFKKGAFHLAIQAGVPMVPIVIRNAGDVAPKGDFVFRSATVDVKVLPPVDTSEWRIETIDDHVLEVRNQFARALGQEEKSAPKKKAAKRKTATKKAGTRTKATAKAKAKPKAARKRPPAKKKSPARKSSTAGKKK